MPRSKDIPLLNWNSRNLPQILNHQVLNVDVLPRNKLPNIPGVTSKVVKNLKEAVKRNKNHMSPRSPRKSIGSLSRRQQNKNIAESMKGAMNGILSGAYPTRKISPRLKQISEKKNMFILKGEKSKSICEQSTQQYVKLF